MLPYMASPGLMCRDPRGVWRPSEGYYEEILPIYAKSYEKAFNLAIDIDDEDLFMDLTNCTKQHGYSDISREAYLKAEEIISRPDSRQSLHSLCSRESCSACATNSSADEDSGTERSWNGADTKVKQKKENIIADVNCKTESTRSANHKNVKHQSNMSANNFSNIRINIPKPELKVSHYSKNTAEYAKQHLKTTDPHKNGEMLNYSSTKAVTPRSVSEMDLNQLRASNNLESKSSLATQSRFSPDNTIYNVAGVNPLKYQPTKEVIQKPQSKLNLTASQMHPIPQHHHVVDIVPKPSSRQFMHDCDLLDQTIGIPLTNSMSMLETAEYNDRNMQPIYHQPKPMLPSKSWSTQNIPGCLPQIIHHPLVSGHIPPSYHFSTENHLIKKKIPMDTSPMPLPPKPVSRQPPVSSSILTTTTQQNPYFKKDTGEKNKVKFSNTVTVAVVPDIQRKEKFDRGRRNNDYPSVHSYDPRRELQESLPLCHPHDDYLKDFTPMSLQEAASDSKSPGSKKGVLTWV